jgi:hypothetical protein
MNWLTILNDTRRKTDRQVLASIPRSGNALPVIVAINCPDKAMRGRLVQLAETTKAHLRDPANQPAGTDASASPADAVLVTAVAGGLACFADFTDRAVVLHWLNKDLPGLYNVVLRYHIGCGGVSISGISKAHSKAYRDRRARSELGLDLVYRHISHKIDLLIFAQKERAFHVHQIWQAIKQAQTWAQFAFLLPAGEWQRLLKMMEDEPAGGEEFSAAALPGFSDGDYPPWLQTEVASCVPAELCAKYGQKRDSCVNGPYWDIPAQNEAALVTSLQGLGYSIERKGDWFFY